MLRLRAPISICGDVHGQFNDVLHMFSLAGDMRTTNVQFLFLGDIVDRGAQSTETLQLLFCYKVRYPERMWMIRGNHESRVTSREYGYYDEVMAKYGDAKFWNASMDACDFIPIAAVIGQFVASSIGRNDALTVYADIVGSHSLCCCDLIQTIPSSACTEDCPNACTPSAI